MNAQSNGETVLSFPSVKSVDEFKKAIMDFTLLAQLCYPGCNKRKTKAKIEQDRKKRKELMRKKMLQNIEDKKKTLRDIVAQREALDRLEQETNLSLHHTLDLLQQFDSAPDLFLDGNLPIV